MNATSPIKNNEPVPNPSFYNELWKNIEEECGPEAAAKVRARLDNLDPGYGTVPQPGHSNVTKEKKDDAATKKMSNQSTTAMSRLVILAVCLTGVLFLVLLFLGVLAIASLVAGLVTMNQDDTSEAVRIAIAVTGGVSWGCLGVMAGCAAILGAWGWIVYRVSLSKCLP